MDRYNQLSKSLETLTLEVCNRVQTHIIYDTHIIVRIQISMMRHHLKSQSDLRVFSNRHPFQILRSMADLLVRVSVREYVSDVNLRK